MWLAQQSRKKNYQKIASAPNRPSLTVSCFQLYSPAGQVLSGCTLTRGETNKDSQGWAVKLLQSFFFYFWGHELLLPILPGPFISYESAGCKQFLWTLECPSYSLSERVAMASWFLLCKPLGHYHPQLSPADPNYIMTKRVCKVSSFQEYFPHQI